MMRGCLEQLTLTLVLQPSWRLHGHSACFGAMVGSVQRLCNRSSTCLCVLMCDTLIFLFSSSPLLCSSSSSSHTHTHTHTHTGWRPGRTIVLCSWDAEEYSVVGSTEWVEVSIQFYLLSMQDYSLLHLATSI